MVIMICTIMSDGSELNFKCKNEFEEPYITLKSKLAEIIWKLYCANYKDIYLNCEYGIPLWSAEIVLALKQYNDISLQLIIPYENQAESWCEENRNRYYAIHEKSDAVIMLSTSYYPECYNNANEFMKNKSNLVLYFNEESYQINLQNGSQIVSIAIKSLLN